MEDISGLLNTGAPEPKWPESKKEENPFAGSYSNDEPIKPTIPSSYGRDNDYSQRADTYGSFGYGSKSDEGTEAERVNLYLKLKALQRRGVILSEELSPKWNIEKLRLEYENQKKIIETEAAIKFMRKGLLFCTTGIEYMNKKFDPVGAKLDGWSDSVMENLMDFDGIFQELHEEYTPSVQIDPMIKLILALGGSAFTFHLTNTMFSSALPQMGSVLKENPDLMQGLFGAVKEAANRSPQSQSMNQPMNQPMNSQGGMSNAQPSFDINSLMGQLGKNSVQGTNLSEQQERYSHAMNNMPGRPIATRDLPEPSMTDNYRKQMEREDDLMSDASGSPGANIISSPKGNILKLG